MTEPTTEPETDPFIPPAPAEKARGPALLPVAAIDASGRRRAVNEAAVAQMADSIESRGLITPILVRPVGDGFRLVVGGHRLAAVTVLGWAEVPCEVRELDDDEALGLELDENLARHELDKLDFGLFCAERQALDERMAERDREGGDRRSAEARSRRQVGDVVPRFTAELAERIGKGERTVQRAIATVRALDPETVALVRGTPVADNESKLIALGRETNLNLRRNMARAMASGVAKTVQDAKVKLGVEPEPGEDPQETHYGQLCRAWTLSDEKTRLRFLALIDAAIIGKKTGEMTPEMRRALDAPEASTAPSRGGRRPGKGAR